MNSKSKGLATPSLVPEENKGSPSPEANIPETTESLVGVVPSAPRGPIDDDKAVGEGGQEDDVELLCVAVKKAWTEEVVAGDGGSGEEAGNAADCCGVEEGGVRDVADIAAVVDADVEGEEEEEEDEQDSSDDDDEDDKWDPEEDNGEEEQSQPPSQASAFSADDFPALGSKPAAAPATPSPSTECAPPVEATSSWSLMARSNPAPFKIPVKSDPAPLPAAAAPATSDDPAHTAGHFSATSASPSQPPRPDGAKVGTSRILSTAAAFGVSGGGAEDDDGEGWINPSNIKGQKAAGIGLNGPSQSQRKAGRASASTVAGQCRAGCVTTDFAMQNVILQVLC